MEEYIIPRRKRIPYGMMNFAVIRRDDCYYVDKTQFIPMIEEADKFFFFIRPCRFGKSLTVNMLQHYYDILAKNKFDALFGDLYIGKHPTPTTERGWMRIVAPPLRTSAKYMPTICHKIRWKN